MSYDQGPMIWVSDLDDYIDIDAISREAEEENRKRALGAEVERIGDLSLFCTRSLSFGKLQSRGVTPDRWRWMRHRAERSLGRAHDAIELEASFLKAILSLGRRYAVARYARLENLPVSTAIAATFPHGVRALIYSYMAGERLLSGLSSKREAQRSLYLARSNQTLTAYEQTGFLQRSLHQIAISVGGEGAHLQLNKHQMRDILSVTRLHFATLECDVRSAAELRDMNLKYEVARARTEQGAEAPRTITGKEIRNWELRSLHPLTFYFPFALRCSLDRLLEESCERKTLIQRAAAVNELSLAICAIELMRESSAGKIKPHE